MVGLGASDSNGWAGEAGEGMGGMGFGAKGVVRRKGGGDEEGGGRGLPACSKPGIENNGRMAAWESSCTSQVLS